MRSFEKQRVSDQIVNAICDQIRAGVWTEALPSERWLSADLGVGRDQVHQAIIKMREMGVVALDGRKNKILGLGGVREGLSSVVVMTPQKLQAASYGFLFCVDQLRDRLGRKNIPVYVETSVSLKKESADKRLEGMLERHPKAVWVLHRSSPSIQRWFEARGVPVIILGTSSETVSLPCIDIDHVATVRHSLGVMKRAGHSLDQVLFLRPTNRLEGVLRMEVEYRRFMEAAGLTPCVMSYKEDYDGLESKLSALFEQKHLIEGVITTSYRAGAYIGGWLACQRGLMVGRDLSLVCLADGPALGHLYPSVAHYWVHGDAFARKLVRMVGRLLTGGAVLSHKEVLVMPDYVDGDSVCRPSPK